MAYDKTHFIGGILFPPFFLLSIFFARLEAHEIGGDQRASKRTHMLICTKQKKREKNAMHTFLYREKWLFFFKRTHHGIAFPIFSLFI